MRLLDACSSFVAHNRKVRHPKTESHYRLACRQYSQAIGRPAATIDDLSDDGLILMEKRLLESHSVPTVNSQLSRVRAIWRWISCPPSSPVIKSPA